MLDLYVLRVALHVVSIILGEVRVVRGVPVHVATCRHWPTLQHLNAMCFPQFRKVESPVGRQ